MSICIKIVKFIYSENATKFCEISTLHLSYVVGVKSTVEISHNFVIFLEYMNFKYQISRTIWESFRLAVPYHIFLYP